MTRSEFAELMNDAFGNVHANVTVSIKIKMNTRMAMELNSQTTKYFQARLSLKGKTIDRARADSDRTGYWMLDTRCWLIHQLAAPRIQNLASSLETYLVTDSRQHSKLSSFRNRLCCAHIVFIYHHLVV